MNKPTLTLLALLAAALTTGAAEEKTNTKKDAKSKTESRTVTVQKSATGTDGAPATGTVVVTTDVDGNRETKTYTVGGAGGGGGNVRLHSSRYGQPAGPVTYLGVATGEVRDDLAAHLPIDKGTGLVALSVAKDSPAAQAGLQDNDVLVKLDDQLLIHPQQLQVLVRNKKDGDQVKLTYIRKGELKTATAKLVKREAPAEELHRGALLTDPISQPPLNDFVRDLSRAQVPIFHRQTVVVGPDGNVRAWDMPLPDMKKIADDVIAGLKKAGVSEEVQEQVRRSIEGQPVKRKGF